MRSEERDMRSVQLLRTIVLETSNADLFGFFLGGGGFRV
jgi:hypothetical protein